jgi:hypothetical protein
MKTKWRSFFIYLSLCLIFALFLMWAAIEIWTRWKVVALIVGLVIALLTLKGCGNYGDNA